MRAQSQISNFLITYQLVVRCKSKFDTFILEITISIISMCGLKNKCNILRLRSNRKLDMYK